MKHLTTTLGIIVLLLTACSKDSKDPIYVNISAVMAHDGVPISGICWNIVETKSEGLIGGDINPTGWELGGTTDNAGISVIEFYPKKDFDYQYEIYFDYSNMNVPVGNYDIVNGPTSLAHVNHSSTNNFEIRVLPIMPVQINFENINCHDSNDTFKYKKYNLSANNNISQNQIDNWPWLEGPSLNGCVNFIGTAQDRDAGYYVFQWEATRNGITEQDTDTFYVAPSVNNLIEMLW
ncbi:MAG: hypothetical protein QNK23_03190 [Crocinitomicaceae bacterium]|nr:hypothetical protein [Crocinitomicaceae bacterium]